MRGARIINRRPVIVSRNPDYMLVPMHHKGPSRRLVENEYGDQKVYDVSLSEAVSQAREMLTDSYSPAVAVKELTHLGTAGKRVKLVENPPRIINRRPVTSSDAGRIRSNPYVAIPSPHELFYRAHQGLSGSWDVRRAGYHGKLEILESGLTESKARALAASANAEIRTEREAFFETQPLGAFRNPNPAEESLHKWMPKLTPQQAEEVMRYADRIFYAALSEGFDSVRAREASDTAAERKAKELAKR